LLIDFTVLQEDEIVKRRNDLYEETNRIYQRTPRTDKKSYEDAQDALKNNEEQYFHPEEIDSILPAFLGETAPKQKDGDAHVVGR
jgi:hypothetical protein